MKRKLVASAIKTPKGVVSKKPPAHHVDVAKKARDTVGTDRGKRGFVTKDGEFVGRQPAKRMAKKTGQGLVCGSSPLVCDVQPCW